MSVMSRCALPTLVSFRVCGRLVVPTVRRTRKGTLGGFRVRTSPLGKVGGDRVVTPTSQCANAKPAQRTEYVRVLPIRRPANFPELRLWTATFCYTASRPTEEAVAGSQARVLGRYDYPRMDDTDVSCSGGLRRRHRKTWV
jgi:hypothetical protein